MFLPVDWLLRALMANKVVVDTLHDGDLRPHLYGIYLSQHSGRGWLAAATNGHWLVRATRTAKYFVDAPDDCIKGSGEFFIPAREVPRYIADLKLIVKERHRFDTNYSKRSKKWIYRDWLRIDPEEGEATHALGTISFQDPLKESYPPVNKVIPKYDRPLEVDGKKMPHQAGVTPVGVSAFYLGRAAEVMAAFYGVTSRSRRFRDKGLRIFTGPTDLDPILLTPGNLLEAESMHDTAIIESTLKIVVMPMRC